MDRLKISVEYQYWFVHNASVTCMIILPVNKTSEVFKDLTGFSVTRVNWTSADGVRLGQLRFCENLSGLFDIKTENL